MTVPAFIERWKIRRKFEKYLSPDVIKKAEEDFKRHPLGKEPEPAHFQFIIVQIDESTPTKVSALLGKVIEVCFRHGGFISNVSVSLVIAYLGKPFDEHNTADARMALVNDLMRENPDRLRLAHGECNGLIGNFGVPQRFTWGALIPNFSGILRTLLDAPPGTAIEVTNEPTQR